MNMKIKKFYENEVQGTVGNVDLVNDFSLSESEEIIKNLKLSMNIFQTKIEEFKKYENQLSKFKSKSRNKSDQIDDSVIEFQRLIKLLEDDIQNRLETLIYNMNDYIKNGRNYIY